MAKTGVCQNQNSNSNKIEIDKINKNSLKIVHTLGEQQKNKQFLRARRPTCPTFVQTFYKKKKFMHFYPQFEFLLWITTPLY